MTDAFRPLPDDPGAEETMTMFDARADNWLLAADGSFRTGAAEVMRHDGTGFRRVVIVEWPGRPNHSDEHVTVRLMMSPRDATGFSRALAHTAAWMLAAATDTGDEKP